MQNKQTNAQKSTRRCASKTCKTALTAQFTCTAHWLSLKYLTLLHCEICFWCKIEESGNLYWLWRLCRMWTVETEETDKTVETHMGIIFNLSPWLRIQNMSRGHICHKQHLCKLVPLCECASNIMSYLLI